MELLASVDLSSKVTLSSDVQQVLMARNGAVLGPSTILKADYFPGLEKLSLEEYV
jgi:hypothetical protein